VNLENFKTNLDKKNLILKAKVTLLIFSFIEEKSTNKI